MPTAGATEQTAEPTLYATSLMDSLIYRESIRWAEGSRDRKGERTGEEGCTPLPPPELGSAEPKRASLARPQRERAYQYCLTLEWSGALKLERSRWIGKAWRGLVSRTGVVKDGAALSDVRESY